MHECLNLLLDDDDDVLLSTQERVVCGKTDVDSAGTVLNARGEGSEDGRRPECSLRLEVSMAPGHCCIASAPTRRNSRPLPRWQVVLARPSVRVAALKAKEEWALYEATRRTLPIALIPRAVGDGRVAFGGLRKDGGGGGIRRMSNRNRRRRAKRLRRAGIGGGGLVYTMDPAVVLPVVRRGPGGQLTGDALAAWEYEEAQRRSVKAEVRMKEKALKRAGVVGRREVSVRGTAVTTVRAVAACAAGAYAPSSEHLPAFDPSAEQLPAAAPEGVGNAQITTSAEHLPALAPEGAIGDAEITTSAEHLPALDTEGDGDALITSAELLPALDPSAEHMLAWLLRDLGRPIVRFPAAVSEVAVRDPLTGKRGICLDGGYKSSYSDIIYCPRLLTFLIFTTPCRFWAVVIP